MFLFVGLGLVIFFCVTQDRDKNECGQATFPLNSEIFSGEVSCKIV